MFRTLLSLVSHPVETPVPNRGKITMGNSVIFHYGDDAHINVSDCAAEFSNLTIMSRCSLRHALCIWWRFRRLNNARTRADIAQIDIANAQDRMRQPWRF